MRTLAIANQKGGVGKTTTAVNLATSLAAAGRRVLLIDLDPQGNASTGLGIARNRRAAGTYQALLGGGAAMELGIPTDVAGLHLLVADPDLAGAEVELAGLERREYFLRDALHRSEEGAHDYAIIDCPPSLGLLTLNGLVAADGVLVPLQCEFFALEGISQIVRTVERVRQRLNPRLHLQGIVLTMFDRRNNLSELVAADARSFFGDRVYKTVIPRNIRVSEAPSHGLPALIYDHSCSGSRAYMALARELIGRLSQQRKAA